LEFKLVEYHRVMSSNNNNKIFKIVYQTTKPRNVKIDLHSFDYDIISIMTDMQQSMLNGRMIKMGNIRHFSDVLKIGQLTIKADLNHNIVILLLTPTGYRIIYKDNYISAIFNSVDDVKFISKFFDDCEMSGDCPICYIPSDYFLSCKNCLNKVCYNFSKKLPKCPFCRTDK
jgi:hypothetical protein